MESTIRQAVVETIKQVLADRGGASAELNDSTGLFAGGVGLDSLDFATVVVRLEQQLNYDPFRAGVLDRMPASLGQLIAAYEAARPKDRPSGV